MKSFHSFTAYLLHGRHSASNYRYTPILWDPKTRHMVNINPTIPLGRPKAHKSQLENSKEGFSWSAAGTGDVRGRDDPNSPTKSQLSSPRAPLSVINSHNQVWGFHLHLPRLLLLQEPKEEASSRAQVDIFSFPPPPTFPVRQTGLQPYHR